MTPVTPEPTPLELIEFEALRNALYHTSRRLHFELWNRVFTFLLVLAGTGTILDIIANLPNAQAALGVGITLIGTLQLVIDLPGAARTHQDLQRRYYEVLGAIRDRPSLSEAECASFNGILVRISGDEPPSYRLVDAVSHNEANSIVWGDQRLHRRIKIGFWRHLVRQYLHQNGWQPSYVGPTP